MIICAITLDTEPDCDLRWRLSDPLTFDSITSLIPALYRPMWNKFNVKPTYFISPNVLRSEAAINVLRNELGRGAEIGCHLHPEYIEPVRKYHDPAGTVPVEFACTAYPTDVEFEKIKNFTEQIASRIGQRPVAYRAGRFGADSDTIRSLSKLGYLADSSITPGIDWTKRGGPDHSNAPLQPYYIAPENYYEPSSESKSVLEIPVTVFGKRFGPLGRLLPDNWLCYNWLRPSHMTVVEQKILIDKTIDLFRDQPAVVFTMMFHSMEPLTKSTPFVRSRLEQSLYVNRLTRVIQYLRSLGCQFMTISEIANYYRQYHIVPAPSALKRGLKFNNYLRYKNVSATQYDKRNPLQYFLWRKPSDRILMPLVRSIRNSKVLDVGCGTGGYTNHFLAQNNQVTGVDKNIHLAAGQPFSVIEGGADNFKDKVPGKYDLVFSSWLTDYLGPDELKAFIQNSQAVLEPNGELIFTAISPKGWGGLYIQLARRIRRVKKYCYRPETIRQWLDQPGFTDIRIVPMNSRFRIPWAYVVRAKKTPIKSQLTILEKPRLKIGLMARGLTKGGVTRFINNILMEFNRLNDPRYQFILFVDDQSYVGRYKHIRVVYRKKVNKIIWECFQILPDLRRERCDALLYPKNTIPLTHHLFAFKKLVIIHDLAYIQEKYLEYKLLDTLYLRFLTPVSCRKADYVLTVSESTKRAAMRKLKLRPEKIRVIHESVEDEFKRPIPNSERERTLANLGIRRPYLFYCGTLSPRKNALRTLQAFQQIKHRLPHTIYMTVGTSWHDKNVRRYIRENLADRVCLLGHITEQELRVLYQSADLLLYPSLLEGFGLPILEAQASGCPVLTSNISSCPETAGRGAHIVNPYSVDEIRDGILKIVTDEAYRNRLIELGQQNIERFSWKKVVENILNVIE